MRATSAVGVFACAGLLVSCGTSASHKGARAPEQQVNDAVALLQRDLVTRNWADLCDQVLSSQARAQAGGADCPAFVSRGASGLRAARIRIRSIDVNGDRATAAVITSAAGQANVPETIELVREGGRFRVDSLAR
jgi:hypothetical protein